MSKVTATLMAVVILFLAGCGTLYIEGASSFTSILNQDLTEKPAVALSWLAGKKVVVVQGRSYYCSSAVVGHELETWLGNRGARPVVDERSADYKTVFYADYEHSGYYGRVKTVEVRLRIVDRSGGIQATSKGESSYWEYQSEAGENSLCEDAARRAVKNLQ